MSSPRMNIVLVFAIGCGALAFTPRANAQDPHGHKAVVAEFPIPASIKAEHSEIHNELVAATKLAGQTGEAARNLARILDPHFQREEQIALPPLGLLEPLSKGRFEPVMSEITFMTDSLRAEMPQMLAEHTQIKAAVAKLEAAAKADNNAAALALAEKLKIHALTEEEVLYPAAVIAGDLVKLRDAQKPKKAAGGRK